MLDHEDVKMIMDMMFLLLFWLMRIMMVMMATWRGMVAIILDGDTTTFAVDISTTSTTSTINRMISSDALAFIDSTQLSNSTPGAT